MMATPPFRPMMPPLRFQPLYQPRVWGGRRLETVLGRKLPDSRPYGESWELCDRAEFQSIVMDGSFADQSLHDLWMEHRVEVFGKRYAGHPAPRFPMLLKVLDCEDVLSLQVHPPAEKAAALGGEPKTEMWYVAHADPGAAIYAGLKRGVTREKFVQALEEGTVAELVHRVHPEKGQCMLVESGRLHALGAGLLVYEIQQNSDTTYRVFDWNRVGLDGRPRELHVQESLECIDFSDVEPSLKNPASDGTLGRCPWFDVRSSSLREGRQAVLSHPEDFVCVAVIGGRIEVSGTKAKTGAFLLVPPGLENHPRVIAATSDAEWLEIRLP